MAPEQRSAGLAPVAEQAVVTVDIDGNILAGVGEFVARVFRAVHVVVAIDRGTVLAIK